MFDNICVKYDEGVFYAPARVGEFNFCPQNGELFCRYEAMLGENELVGANISAIGLTIGKNTYSLTAEKPFEHQKIAQRLVLSITLAIDQDGDFRFLAQDDGGENRFVRNILSGEYYFSGYELGICEDFLPHESIYFNPSSVIEKKTVQMTSQSGAMVFSAEPFSSPAKEAVLFYQSQAVVRASLEPQINLKSSSVVAQGMGCYTLNEQRVGEVFDVRVDSYPCMYFALSLAESLLFMGSLRSELSQSTQLKGSYLNTLALLDEHGIMLTNGVEPLRWLDGSDIKLVSNGAMVVFGEDITIIDQSGQHKLKIASGTKNNAVFSGGIYMIGCFDEGVLNVYRVSSNSDYSVSSFSVSSLDDVALVDIFGTYLGVICPDFGCAYSVLGDENAVGGWLNDIKDLVDINDAVDFNAGRLTFFNGVDSYYVNFMDNVRHDREGLLYDDFIVTHEGDCSSISLFEDSCLVATLEGRINGLSRAGDELYVLNNNRLSRFYIGSKKTRLFSQAIKENSTISYNVRTLAARQGAVTLKIDVR